MKVRLALLGLVGTVAALIATPASATVPYTPIALPPGAMPGIGPGLISPKETFGKEYSHDTDQTTLFGGGISDPEQVIAWDGIGGTADGLDYSGTRLTFDTESQVDATANHADALFRQVREDRAHLIFSHDDMVSVYFGAPPGPGGGSFSPVKLPSAGPVTVSGGNSIGGAGEISYEVAGLFAPPSTQGVWATQSEVNGMPRPADVDGVEVWGPEPGTTGDADKYSLQVDFMSGGFAGAPATSVWNLAGTPYIPHATIVAAVTSLLGPVPGGAVLPFPTFIDGDDAINLDALMVYDAIGEIDSFDRTPDGSPGDQIIFSIQQIPNSSDPDGYYATGSELFVLDASLGPGGVKYLEHGGHAWDQGYALSSLAISPNLIDNGYGVIDINAIEAIGALIIPEPASLTLLAAGLGAMAMLRFHRKES
jgi:hypothetical protein